MAAFAPITATAPTTPTTPTTAARSTRRPAGRRPPRCPTLTAAIAAGAHSAAAIPAAPHGHATSADVPPVPRRRSRRRSSPPPPSVAVGTPPWGGESAALPTDHARRVPLAPGEVVTAPGTPVDADAEEVGPAFVARLQAALTAVVQARAAAAAAGAARATAAVEAATVAAKPAVQSKGRVVTKRSRPAANRKTVKSSSPKMSRRAMVPVDAAKPPTAPAAPKEPQVTATPVANRRRGRRYCSQRRRCRCVRGEEGGGSHTPAQTSRASETNPLPTPLALEQSRRNITRSSSPPPASNENLRATSPLLPIPVCANVSHHRNAVDGRRVACPPPRGAQPRVRPTRVGAGRRICRSPVDDGGREDKSQGEEHTTGDQRHVRHFVVRASGCDHARAAAATSASATAIRQCCPQRDNAPPPASSPPVRGGDQPTPPHTGAPRGTPGGGTSTRPDGTGLYGGGGGGRNGAAGGGGGGGTPRPPAGVPPRWRWLLRVAATVVGGGGGADGVDNGQPTDV
ncbi:hypothetical protein BU14_0973s0003 [Porphyra umbilicalis]|uniref:Uncharacterized protein n=1 Tax=Porphyra umbilicalis TaxID=2786 RepID=A0A1X6NMV6_PORUM|nr:hypothetical protein BU14_0973s0003 [Porphyra umbilicalis]|eukprot:OSX69979.1 hypothetical protein BU14_0973s0003 [Porphyra umbilicalis]